MPSNQPAFVAVTLMADPSTLVFVRVPSTTDQLEENVYRKLQQQQQQQRNCANDTSVPQRLPRLHVFYPGCQWHHVQLPQDRLRPWFEAACIHKKLQAEREADMIQAAADAEIPSVCLVAVEHRYTTAWVDDGERMHREHNRLFARHWLWHPTTACLRNVPQPTFLDLVTFNVLAAVSVNITSLQCTYEPIASLIPTCS